MLFISAGGPTSSHVVQGLGEDPTQCSVVLQEGPWLQHTQEEKNEATQEENEKRRHGCG